jgi:hypothetical protein
MKTSQKLTFSLWLTLITALASVDPVKAGVAVDSNFHAPFFATASPPARAALLPDVLVLTRKSQPSVSRTPKFFCEKACLNFRVEHTPTLYPVYSPRDARINAEARNT